MNRAIVMVTSIVCVTLIMIVAVKMGHDATLVTGAVATIIGAGTGFAAYYKGKSKEAEKQFKDTNDSMLELAKALYQLFEANIKEEE